MLNFHFLRCRKTHIFKCVSLRSETEEYKVKYDFKEDQAHDTLAPDVIQAILEVLNTIPYQHGLFHFPEFFFDGNGIELSKAKVFQNVSSLQDATVTFQTELVNGTTHQLMRDFNMGSLIGQSQSLDLLLNATVHVLNINMLQLQNLKSIIDDGQLATLEKQHADLVSLLKNVADTACFGTGTQKAGLNSRLAALALEDFTASDLHH